MIIERPQDVLQAQTNNPEDYNELSDDRVAILKTYPESLQIPLCKALWAACQLCGFAELKRNSEFLGALQALNEVINTALSKCTIPPSDANRGTLS